MSRSDKSSSSDDEINFDLEKRIQNFVAAKRNLLFSNEDSNRNETQSEKDVIMISDQFDEDEMTHLYIDLPPIETFMNISTKNRKEHLFKILEKGDIIIASVDEIKQEGIKMNMVCFDNWKRRDLEFVKFDVICPMENLPDKYLTTNGDILSKLKTVYFKNDLLRCVVNDIDNENFICNVSLKWADDLIKREENDRNKLGLISSEDLPIYYQNIGYFEKEPYLFNKKLKRQRQFNNPGFIDLMIKKLNLSNLTNQSLMKGLENIKIDEKETAPELHKQQNKNLALQSVQRGVSLFREGKSNDAMLSYNKALSIDSDNVEAYVARGALSASDGDFDKAIKDLEKALLLDSNHSNARTYLKEVFLAYATRNEKNENYDDSLKYMKKALEIDPNNELISSKIADIKIKIEDSYNKNRYGPSLPRQVSSYSSTSEKSNKNHHKSKSKKSKKKSSSSSRSRSTSRSSEDLNGSNNSNRKLSSRSKSKDESRHNSRKNSSYEDSKQSNKASSVNRKSDPKSRDESDNEDLEEFYNKLKKNKGSR